MDDMGDLVGGAGRTKRSSASSVALIVEMKDCRLSREKVVRQGQQF